MSSFSQIVKPVYVTGGAVAIGVIDKATFTYGTSVENPIGGVYQDTSPTLTAGTTGAFRSTAYRALHANLRDSSGNELLAQQLMALSIPVVIASNQSTIPVSAASLPLPAGAATSANQLTEIGSLASIDGKLPATLGQKVMASSLAIAIASDQSAIPVSQSGTWNITNISGTISLPTGAATETTLSSINTKVPALGQALAAGSVPVVLTAAQLSTLTPLATVAATQSGTWNITNISGTVSLPTGAATLAKQPALGTAGTASADVITVQGIASMTALQVTQKSGGTLTDRSGSTSGTPSTSTQVAASLATRRYFFIENLDASNSIWINFTTAASAAAGSIKIVAGGAYVMEDGFCSTEAINVLAAVASVAFTAKEG